VGYHPNLDGLEGGLWHAVDKIEADVKTSPLLVKDEALNAYVRGIVCKLVGPECSDIRVYILDQPYFNAAAYANGMLQVWTGLLLRTENEAQLAFVLGHELTHYRNRHTLKQLESAQDTSGALMVFSIATAGAGVGLVGALAGVAAQGAFVSYSRSQEAEADAGGFDLAVAQGYDPRQAARIWSSIQDEEKADPHKKTLSLFGSNHPSNEARMAAMTASADALEDRTHADITGIEAYRAATIAHRAQWLDEELNRGEPAESIAMIERLLQNDPHSRVLQFYRGEAYRRRNAPSDLAQAIAAYRAGIDAGDAPDAVYRGLGLATLKAGDHAGARDAFTTYLNRVPGADDRGMVQMYVGLAGESP
jgi:predicted Zn-dependent protease